MAAPEASAAACGKQFQEAETIDQKRSVAQAGTMGWNHEIEFFRDQ